MRRKQNLDIIMSDLYLELEQKLVHGEIGTDEFKEEFDRRYEEEGEEWTIRKFMKHLERYKKYVEVITVMRALIVVKSAH